MILISCNSGSKSNSFPDRIELESEYSLKIPEPSGLTFTYDQKGFWTVSDENSTVYLIDYEGTILKSFTVEGYDLEGITVINDTLLAVVLEPLRIVVITDTSGSEMQRIKLDMEGEDNDGLEGIAYDSLDQVYYIIKEKNPSELLVVSENFEIVRQKQLNFAKDYSGIYFDQQHRLLWMVSDESQTINVADTDGKLLKEYKHEIAQIEGISVDVDSGLIYVVSDNTEKLYKFKFGD